jgi:hypothetical protein
VSVTAPHVVMLVLDGMPDRHVQADAMPSLWHLAMTGTRTSGRAVMTSATYPNHATFATGVDPMHHGLVANVVFVEDHLSGGHATERGWQRGPSAPTVFDVLADRHTEAVLGDHHLVGTMGATRAVHHWPPDGVRPDGVALDPYGYVDDAVTIELICDAVARRPELMIGHLNGPDTYGHIHGPDSAEALAVHRVVDEMVGRVVSTLDWDRSVLVVVSDHDQETTDDQPPIDLRDVAAANGFDVAVIDEGCAALVRGWPSSGPDVDSVPGVVASVPVPNSTDLLVWCEPGRWFGAPDAHRTIGVHGGPRTRAQVAVVSGGHPAARALGTSVAGRTVDAREWAPLLLSVLTA